MLDGYLGSQKTGNIDCRVNLFGVHFLAVRTGEIVWSSIRNGSRSSRAGHYLYNKALFSYRHVNVIHDRSGRPRLGRSWHCRCVRVILAGGRMGVAADSGSCSCVSPRLLLWGIHGLSHGGSGNVSRVENLHNERDERTKVCKDSSDEEDGVLGEAAERTGIYFTTDVDQAPLRSQSASGLVVSQREPPRPGLPAAKSYPIGDTPNRSGLPHTAPRWWHGDGG